MKYRLYGLVIEIDELLQEIKFTEQTEVDVQVWQLFPSESIPSPSSWFLQCHLPGGELWLLFAKMDGGYLLRFHELVDFFVSDNGKNILYVSKDETPLNTIQHLLLNQVIPLVINLRGSEALHASSVSAQRRTIAFIGSTGSGKSTLAGSFLSAGHPLMSDDCLAVLEKKVVSTQFQLILDLGFGKTHLFVCLEITEDSKRWPITHQSVSFTLRRNRKLFVRSDSRSIEFM